MRNWIAALVVATSLVGVGCTQDRDMKDNHRTAAGDACKHCPGMQKATANGKCPKCGMSVSTGDACPKCAGTQTANAKGECASCGGKAM